MSTICALLQDYGFCHVQHLRRLTTVNAQVLRLSERFLILTVATKLKSRLTSFCYQVILPVTRVNIRVHKLERHSSERIMRQVLSNLITVIRCQPAIQYDTIVAPCSHQLITWTYRTPSV